MKAQEFRALLAIILLVISVPISEGIRFTKENLNLAGNTSIYSTAFDFEGVYANILWINTIQMMGTMSSGPLSEKDAQNIFSMFDRVTDMDPGFYLAYKYGGLTLGVESPELAKAILDKGMKNMPDSNWEIPFYVAVIAYHTLKDYNLACEYLKEAAKYPEHPSYIDRLLARSFVKAGDLKVAFDLWNEIYEKAPTPLEKNMASRNLLNLAKKIIDESPDTTLKNRAQAIAEQGHN